MIADGIYLNENNVLCCPACCDPVKIHDETDDEVSASCETCELSFHVEFWGGASKDTFSQRLSYGKKKIA